MHALRVRVHECVGVPYMCVCVFVCASLMDVFNDVKLAMLPLEAAT